MERLWRFLKHRWHDEGSVQRALPPAAVHRLQQQLQGSESRHGGEIRVCVEAGLPVSYLWKRLSARDRALTLFGKLRIWDTEANNGVLIYLLLAEHAIEIVADRGLNQKVDSATWAGVVQRLGEAMRQGACEQGLSQALCEVDALLCTHFPLTEGRSAVNELPDGIILL